MILDSTNDYKLGIKTIDIEHESLITICKDIFDSSLTNEEVKTMLLDYYDLVFKHCLNEEAFMEEINFPGLDQHKEAHQQILYKIFNAIDDNTTCEKHNRKNVMKLIDDTLLNHITSYDFQIRDFYYPKS